MKSTLYTVTVCRNSLALLHSLPIAHDRSFKFNKSFVTKALPDARIVKMLVDP